MTAIASTSISRSGIRQAGHANAGAAGGRLLEELHPDAGHLLPVVGDRVRRAVVHVERVELDDVLHRRAGLGEHASDVLEDVARLGLDVADADRATVLVGADLAADEDEVAHPPALGERHRHRPLPVPLGHESLPTLEHHRRPSLAPLLIRRGLALGDGDPSASRASRQYRVPRRAPRRRTDVNGMRTSRNTSIETRKPANRNTTPRNFPSWKNSVDPKRFSESVTVGMNAPIAISSVAGHARVDPPRDEGRDRARQRRDQVHGDRHRAR